MPEVKRTPKSPYVNHSEVSLLTASNCSVASGAQVVLDDAKMSYQSSCEFTVDGFYPLSPVEQHYIGDESIELYGLLGTMGGSVYFEGQKWLSIDFEIKFSEQGENGSISGATASREDLLAQLEPFAYMYKSLICAPPEPRKDSSDNSVSYLEVKLLIPIVVAIGNTRNFKEWKAFLESELA